MEKEIEKLGPEPDLLYTDPKKVQGKREFYIYSPDKSQRVRIRESTGIGWTVDKYTKTLGTEGAWSIVLTSILISGGVATFLLALTWKMRPRS